MQVVLELEGGHREGAEEGAEGVAGHAGRGEGLEEIVLGVEGDGGTELDVDETGGRCGGRRHVG